jgi:succinate dehydrogenase hydrophobic anchor subunit
VQLNAAFLADSVASHETQETVADSTHKTSHWIIVAASGLIGIILIAVVVSAFIVKQNRKATALLGSASSNYHTL